MSNKSQTTIGIQGHNIQMEINKFQLSAILLFVKKHLSHTKTRTERAKLEDFKIH